MELHSVSAPAQMLSSHAWSGAGWFLLGLAAGRYLLGGGAPSGGLPVARWTPPRPTAHHHSTVAAAVAPPDNALLARVYPLHATAVPWQSVAFKRHPVILVTGPQRSGTTWVACALATQLGYTLYDERHPITGGNNTLRALRHAFSYAQSQEGGAVFQSPMATPILHELPRFSGLLVVFIARNCIDVFRSQNKVNRRAGGWTCAAGRTKELGKYLGTRPGFEQYKEELAPYFDDRDMICKVKQDVWMRYQQPQLAHHEATHPDDYAARGRNLSVTVSFESFSDHPLWLQDDSRVTLDIKKTNCRLVSTTPRRSKASLAKWMAEAPPPPPR